MTFPTVPSVVRLTGDALLDELIPGGYGILVDTATMPSISAGDWVIVLLTLGASATTLNSYPAGYLTLDNDTAVGAGVRQCVFSANNVAGAPTADWIFDIGARSGWAMHIYVVRGVATDIGSTVATGTSTSPNPPSANPTGGAADSLFLIAATVDGTATVSSWPTNYSTNGISDNPGGSGGFSAGSMNSSYRTVNADSEDPGAFTMSASEEWVAYTYGFAAETATETSLTANNVSVAPSVGQPALTQDHSLTATGVAAATVTVGSPALTQDHKLTPNSVVSAPSVGNPALTQAHQLTPSNVSVAPNVGNPALTVDYSLTATGGTVQPSVSTTALTQAHQLAPTGVAAAPSVGTPAITQDHSLTATGASVQPSVGAPDLTVTVEVTANGLTAQPSVGSPVFTQEHLLTPTGISVQPYVGTVTGFDEDEPRDLLAERRQQLNQGQLIHLFILDLNPIGVDEIYYLTTANYEDLTEIVFDGATYNYAPIALTNVDWSANGDPPNPKVTFPNAKKWAAGLARQHADLIGASVRRIRIYREFLDGQPLADVEATYSDDNFRIEQKLNMNRVIAEFSLRPLRSIENKKIPGMVCLKNVCVLRYRRWDVDLPDFVYDTSALACPYVGGEMFTQLNVSTLNPAEDVCSHDMSGCISRFEDAPLPASFKPGMTRLRT